MTNCRLILVRPMRFHITLALLIVASGLLAAPANIGLLLVGVQGGQIEYLTDIDTLKRTPDGHPVSRSRPLRSAMHAASLSKPTSVAFRKRRASLFSPLRLVASRMAHPMTLCAGTTRSPFGRVLEASHTSKI
jgi:hypothetical protein